MSGVEKTEMHESLAKIESAEKKYMDLEQEKYNKATQALVMQKIESLKKGEKVAKNIAKGGVIPCKVFGMMTASLGDKSPVTSLAASHGDSANPLGDANGKPGSAQPAAVTK